MSLNNVFITACESRDYQKYYSKTMKNSLFTLKVLQSVRQLFKIADFFTCTYQSKTNGPVEQYNQTLKSILRCYASDYRKDWHVYGSTLTYDNNRKKLFHK